MKFKYFLLILAILMVAGVITYYDIILEIEDQYFVESIDVSKPPLQQKARLMKINHKGYELTSENSIIFRGKILNVHRYTNDDFAEISPIDIGLGWDIMADEKNLEKITVFQYSRAMYFNISGYMIDKRTAYLYSANIHIIPSNEDLEKIVLKLLKGDIVELKGRLVDVKGEKFWRTTSLSRTDEGLGSTEILWLEDIKIQKRQE
jgi:hypothetical protein